MTALACVVQPLSDLILRATRRRRICMINSGSAWKSNNYIHSHNWNILCALLPSLVTIVTFQYLAPVLLIALKFSPPPGLSSSPLPHLHHLYPPIFLQYLQQIHRVRLSNFNQIHFSYTSPKRAKEFDC